MKKWLCLVLCGVLLFSVSACKKTDGDAVPHGHVSAADLTDKQAQEILEVLIPRQFDVFFLFQLDWEKIDETQPCPFDENYKLCTDERFTCVQDIKDFILQVYTGEQAQWYFDHYLDGPYDPPSNVNYFIDYKGKLWRSTYAEGKGLNYGEYLMDTTHIVERTQNTVSVEMDAGKIEGSSVEEIYTFLLCETPDGWRLNSQFLECYYP